MCEYYFFFLSLSAPFLFILTLSRSLAVRIFCVIIYVIFGYAAVRNARFYQRLSLSPTCLLFSRGTNIRLLVSSSFSRPFGPTMRGSRRDVASERLDDLQTRTRSTTNLVQLPPRRGSNPLIPPVRVGPSLPPRLARKESRVQCLLDESFPSTWSRARARVLPKKIHRSLPA